jgi:Mg2+/Co2+ transporter CorB
MHTVSVLIALTFALVTAKKISATHTNEIIPDMIVTISPIIPLVNPLLTLQTNRRKTINTKMYLNMPVTAPLS